MSISGSEKVFECRMCENVVLIDVTYQLLTRVKGK